MPKVGLFELQAKNSIDLANLLDLVRKSYTNLVPKYGNSLALDFVGRISIENLCCQMDNKRERYVQMMQTNLCSFK